MQAETASSIEAPEMLKLKTQGEESVEDTTAGASDAQAQEKESPIYLGAKKFNSVDELARYTAELEAQKAVPQWQQPMQEVEKPISELLFENPEKALELHEQRVIQKLKAEEAKKKQEQDLWERFYSKNKDLAEDKELVEYVLGKNWDGLRQLHPDQAMEKLADYARGTMSRFRKTPEKNQELPSGQAKVGPSSTQHTAPITEKKAAPVDFVSQLRKIQKSRR